MSKVTKLVVDKLINDLQERPSDFICDQHVLTDMKVNMGYWVANCFFDAGIYRPYELKFGFIQGWRFHSALKKWKAFKCINAEQVVLDKGK